MKKSILSLVLCAFALLMSNSAIAITYLDDGQNAIVCGKKVSLTRLHASIPEATDFQMRTDAAEDGVKSATLCKLSSPIFLDHSIFTYAMVKEFDEYETEALLLTRDQITGDWRGIPHESNL